MFLYGMYVCTVHFNKFTFMCVVFNLINVLTLLTNILVLVLVRSIVQESLKMYSTESVDESIVLRGFGIFFYFQFSNDIIYFHFYQVSQLQFKKIPQYI